MDYDVWINRAIMRVGELEVGKIFVLKDLFLGTEWNELAKGERLNLGRKFKETVVLNKIPDVLLMETKKHTATTYKKGEIKNG